jgi:hypothetical protein
MKADVQQNTEEATVSNDAKDRGTEDTHSDEPALVRFTSVITDTPDPDEADRMVDMLLLFLAAGGTILGTIFRSRIVPLPLHPPRSNVRLDGRYAR